MTSKGGTRKIDTYSVSYAQKHIEALVEKARAGEEVVISLSGKPVARILAIVPPCPFQHRP